MRYGIRQLIITRPITLARFTDRQVPDRISNQTLGFVLGPIMGQHSVITSYGLSIDKGSNPT